MRGPGSIVLGQKLASLLERVRGPFGRRVRRVARHRPLEAERQTSRQDVENLFERHLPLAEAKRASRVRLVPPELRAKPVDHMPITDLGVRKEPRIEALQVIWCVA